MFSTGDRLASEALRPDVPCMTKPAQNGEAAAGAGVLAREGSQDIWARHRDMPRNTTQTLGATNGGRGGLAGYTELCESIAEFKRDSVR
jgi:hypothetical protein